MHTRLIATLPAALLLAACATPSAPPSPPAAPQAATTTVAAGTAAAAGNDVQCVKEHATGSNFTRTRCTTAEQRAKDKANATAVEDALRGRATAGRPNE